MPRVSTVPFEQVDPELQAMMREYDKAVGGSEFMQVFAQAPEASKSFLNFYFPLIMTTRGRVNMKLTEVVRLQVAEKNECGL